MLSSFAQITPRTRASMSQYAEGEKVVLVSNPAQEMTIVEVKGDVLVVSYAVEGKRKMGQFPVGDVKKP